MEKPQIRLVTGPNIIIGYESIECKQYADIKELDGSIVVDQYCPYKPPLL